MRIYFTLILILLNGCCLGEFSGGLERHEDDLSGKTVDRQGKPLSYVGVYRIGLSDTSLIQSNRFGYANSEGMYSISKGFPYSKGFKYGSFPNCGEKNYTNSEIESFALIFLNSSHDTTIAIFLYDTTDAHTYNQGYWFNNADTIFSQKQNDLGAFGENHVLPAIVIK